VYTMAWVLESGSSRKVHKYKGLMSGCMHNVLVGHRKERGNKLSLHGMRDIVIAFRSIRNRSR